MKKFFLILCSVLLLLLCSCDSSKDPWGYNELNELTQTLSDALYCSDLVIIADTAEHIGTTEKDSQTYNLYSVTPRETISGNGKSESFVLEAPVLENGIALPDSMEADTQYLIFAHKTGSNYLIFSDFCLTKLDTSGKLLCDGVEYYGWSTLDDIRTTLNDELEGISDDITPALISRIKTQLREESGKTYKYFESWTWRIYSFEYLDTIFTEDSQHYRDFDSKYRGAKKLPHYSLLHSPYIDEDDIASFGQKGFELHINMHSFSSPEGSFFYDFKTDTLIQY